MSRKRNMPSRRAIAEANEDLIRRLEVSWTMADKTCWACGAAGDDDEPSGWLQRAHVQAMSGGGTDDPSNFFLLCWVCHRDQPDGAPRDVQEEWLLTHESQSDRTSRTAKPVLHWLRVQMAEFGLTAEEARDLRDTVPMRDLIDSAAAAHAGNRSSTFLWSLARRYVDAIKARRGAP